MTKGSHVVLHGLGVLNKCSLCMQKPALFHRKASAFTDTRKPSTFPGVGTPLNVAKLFSLSHLIVNIKETPVLFWFFEQT